MESIKEIFKQGKGPSSSHTMGPRTAAIHFKEITDGAASYSVTLYGSLAATGRGHLTDVAIREVLDKCTIIWQPDVFYLNTLTGSIFVPIIPRGNLLKVGLCSV